MRINGSMSPTRPRTTTVTASTRFGSHAPQTPPPPLTAGQIGSAMDGLNRLLAQAPKNPLHLQACIQYPQNLSPGRAILVVSNFGKSVPQFHQQAAQHIQQHLPQLQPASAAEAQLHAAGYPGDPQTGKFGPNEYALDITKLPHSYFPGTSQKTVLVKLHYVDYSELEYHQQAEKILRRRFMKATGIKNGIAAVSLSGHNSPKAPHPLLWDMLISYAYPTEYGHATPKDIKKALRRLPELVSANTVAADLDKVPGYADYKRKGKYPKNYYALDLTKLPGLTHQPQFSRYMLVPIVNTSNRPIFTPEDQQIHHEFIQQLKTAGLPTPAVSQDTPFPRAKRYPKHLVLHYNENCPPLADLQQALSKVPGIHPAQSKSTELTQAGYQHFGPNNLIYGDNLLAWDTSTVPALAGLKQKTVLLRLHEEQPIDYNYGY